MKKQKQKGISTLVGVIIIVAVAILAFGGVFAYQYFTKSQAPSTNFQQNSNTQNQNTETAGWKTYKNDQYGFELKYPVSYIFSQDNPSVPFFDLMVNHIATINPSDRSNFVGIYIDGNDKVIERCLKFNLNKDEPNMTEVKQINGFNFYTKSQGDAAMGGQRARITQYSTIYNSKCYIMQTTIRWSDVQFVHDVTDGKTATEQEINKQNNTIKTNEEKVNQIISTFKFTK